jgi:putative transposase
VKYACIERCRDRYSVQLMCRLLGVSRSGFYAAKSRPESNRSIRNRELLGEIKRIHAQSKGVYGSPRIRAELADEGRPVGRIKSRSLCV